VIDDIIAFFVSAYSFRRSPMPKGSIIGTSLVKLVRERKILFTDADEDRRPTTLVPSNDLLLCLILTDAEF
jgi:hypothetical protein